MSAKSDRAEYLEEYPECQYTACCGHYVDFPLRVPRENLCIEHIWNRRGRKSECWSNYATVSPEAHTWKHADSVSARIAISWYKMRLWKETGDERHWNLYDLREASGFYVPGWVESKLDTVDLPTWVWEMGADLLESH